jgi:exodeoxyribonuclease VII large subunit
MNSTGLDPQELRFSVDEFNEFINRNFELIGTVAVEGEITQMNITPKGGVNIVLKDAKGSGILNLSGYAPWIEGLKMINSGMKVSAWGKPNVWSQGGKFSLKIFKILPLGEGALKEAYEKLKQKLELEGLFNEERKRPLPDFITRIALLTGKDSAAQSDFLKILQENRAGFNVDFYPVQVQGKYAEREMISTLKNLEYANYDCIALVRGGGSLEDLITFNSENLARILFSLPIPVIVGVGHEKDESIADFVADIRASTPSQAAYYLINNNENFIKKLDLLLQEAESQLRSRLQNIQTRVLLNTQKIQQTFKFKLNSIQNRVSSALNILAKFPQNVKTTLERVNQSERLLNSFNPKNVLQRGYALVKGPKGNVLKSIDQLSVSDHVSLQFIDGEALANILEKKHNDN